MDWADYLRDEAAKYRQLAKAAEDLSIKHFHKRYALDITLNLRGATKSQIERAMRGHVLANAELIGTYQKGDR